VLQKQLFLAAFFDLFFPNITSDGRLLRQMAVCYMTLVECVNAPYVYNSNLFYYIFLKVKLVNLKEHPLRVLFFVLYFQKKSTTFGSSK
jgi:hypothetical protein